MADEGITKAKKKRGSKMVVHHRSERIITYTNRNRPVVSSASFSDSDDPVGDCATPDAVKGTGNPYDHPGVRTPADRMSPPLTAGHQAPSTGDHGAADPMRQPGPRELAWRHENLRQGSTTVRPWQSLSTANQDRPDASIIWGAGRVAVDQLHTTDVAAFTSQPSGNPNVRALPHSAPIGASNGTHSLSDPVSHGSQAMKGSDALRIMRETSRRLG